MEFLRVKEIKVYCVLKTVCFCYRLVSLAFFFTFLAFMLPFPCLFVKDTLGLVLGKCFKVRHSVTKPYKQLHSTVGNITYV